MPIMKAFLQIFKKHPIAISFFVLYNLLYSNWVSAIFELQKQTKLPKSQNNSLSLGEFVGLGGFFLFIIGCLFFLITCGFAIGNKPERKFYVWLSLIIAMEGSTALFLVW